LQQECPGRLRFGRDRLIGTCFLDLFEPDERETMAFRMATTAVLNQVRHVGAMTGMLYVDIRISRLNIPISGCCW
jgi:hypothetical protein